MKCLAGVEFSHGAPCPKCDAKLGEVCWPGINAELLELARLRVEIEQLRSINAQPEPDSEAIKLVYVKRWRTIVKLPAKYADEIVEALRAPAQCTLDRTAIIRAINLSYARADLEPTSPTTLSLYLKDAEHAADAVIAALSSTNIGEAK